MNIVTGTDLGDPPTNVVDNDSTYYRTASSLSASLHTTEWVAEVPVVGAGGTLTVTLDARYDAKGVTQGLYIYNRGTASWQLLSSVPGTVLDRTVTWSTTAPGSYVTPEEMVRVKLVVTDDAPFTTMADYLRAQRT